MAEEENDFLERIREYRNELYKTREAYINLNNNTARGHPITKHTISVYENAIKRLEQLFPELTNQPEVQKIY
ncbi:hypothetical protein J4456_00340 [Candidatus Pacearchaeota archaeon]|nr:hypothetical protein [Candidatus Pacearchaeota archaeon]